MKHTTHRVVYFLDESLFTIYNYSMNKNILIGISVFILLIAGSFFYLKPADSVQKVDTVMRVESLTLFRGGDMQGTTAIKLSGSAFEKIVTTYAGDGMISTTTGTLNLNQHDALNEVMQKHNFGLLQDDPTRGPDMVYSTISAVINGTPHELYCVSSLECTSLADELFAIFDEALRNSKGVN